MKNVLFIIGALSFLISCNEDQELTETYDSINVELAKNELYTYGSKSSGDEDGGHVYQQAKHYEISEVVRDSSFRLVYRYQPEQNYIGKDTVQIVITSGSDGASPPNHFEYITIAFVIEE